jgi:cytidylate kinase
MIQSPSVKNKPIPVIAIDGPTASGKGTIGRKLAKQLGWNFLDSGAIYRVLALSALNQNVQANDQETLMSIASTLDIEFVFDGTEKVISSGFDVTNAIRQEGCGVFASQVAVLPKVREALLECQKHFRISPGLVADGRDMGTLVFPDAILKVFLVASVSERAKRRFQQLQEKGISANLHDVELDLVERDARDEKRLIAPLKPAGDAVIIDTTNLNIDEVVKKIISLYKI